MTLQSRAPTWHQVDPNCVWKVDVPCVHQRLQMKLLSTTKMSITSLPGVDWLPPFTRIHRLTKNGTRKFNKHLSIAKLKPISSTYVYQYIINLTESTQATKLNDKKSGSPWQGTTAADVSTWWWQRCAAPAVSWHCGGWTWRINRSHNK